MAAKLLKRLAGVLVALFVGNACFACASCNI